MLLGFATPELGEGHAQQLLGSRFGDQILRQSAYHQTLQALGFFRGKRISGLRVVPPPFSEFREKASGHRLRDDPEIFGPVDPGLHAQAV
ncbi:hypothetical protein, partial [Deferrisoma palaeochoriense]